MSSKLHDTNQCRMYSGKLLMMGAEELPETCRVSWQKYIWKN